MNTQHKHTPGPWFVGGKTGYQNQLKIEPTIGVVYGAGEQLQANAALVAAAPRLLDLVERCAHLLSRANVSSGVCCCGDSTENHASPYDSGHAPVDTAEYAAERLCKDAVALLATIHGKP
jgi:hypothetical protein